MSKSTSLTSSRDITWPRFRISFKDTKLRLQAPANSLCSVSIVDKGMKPILCRNILSYFAVVFVREALNVIFIWLTIKWLFGRFLKNRDTISESSWDYVICDFGFERSCSFDVRYCHFISLFQTPSLFHVNSILILTN